MKNYWNQSRVAYMRALFKNLKNRIKHTDFPINIISSFICFALLSLALLSTWLEYVFLDAAILHTQFFSWLIIIILLFLTFFPLMHRCMLPLKQVFMSHFLNFVSSIFVTASSSNTFHMLLLESQFLERKTDEMKVSRVALESHWRIRISLT